MQAFVASVLLAALVPASPAAPTTAVEIAGTSGLMSAVALGDGILALTWGGRELLWIGPDGTGKVVCSASDPGVDILGEPVVARDTAYFRVVGDDGVMYLAWTGPDCAAPRPVAGPFEWGGPPSTDPGGGLWFFADECLYCDFRQRAMPAGMTGPRQGDCSPAVSLEQAWLALGREDTVFVGMLSGEALDTLVTGSRVMPMMWRGASTLLIPLADGRIAIRLCGAHAGFLEGGEPCFSMAIGATAWAVTVEDGHQVTASGILFSHDPLMASPPERALFPEGVVPIRPRMSSFGCTAVDAVTGSAWRIPIPAMRWYY